MKCRTKLFRIHYLLLTTQIFYVKRPPFVRVKFQICIYYKYDIYIYMFGKKRWTLFMIFLIIAIAYGCLYWYFSVILCFHHLSVNLNSCIWIFGHDAKVISENYYRIVIKEQGMNYWKYTSACFIIIFVFKDEQRSSLNYTREKFIFCCGGNIYSFVGKSKGALYPYMVMQFKISNMSIEGNTCSWMIFLWAIFQKWFYIAFSDGRWNLKTSFFGFR